MYMKNKIIIYFILLLNFALNAQNIQHNYKDLIVHIEFANPKIYRSGDDVYIQVQLKNNSNEVISSLISKDKKFCFDFEMVTMQNKVISHKREYITSFNRIQPVLNSQIKLNPNEGFTYSLRFNEYFDTETPGQYYLRVKYYPELKISTESSDYIFSNYLTLNIRPKGIENPTIVEQHETEKEIKLFSEKRPPDEVVKYMLNARIEGEWQKFFLYLNLEKLIMQNNHFNTRYQLADIETQKALIDEYKEYLKDNSVADISYLPHSYEIKRTEYSEGKGKVEAVLEFHYGNFKESKFYTYFLDKNDSIWYISSYEVMNIGVSR